MLTATLIAIVIGAISGWAAAKLVRGRGFGLTGDILLGIAGAVVANWILGGIGVTLGGGVIGAILTGILGAVALLFAAKLLRRV